MRTQAGIVRTNCVDCLDRTNVTQVRRQAFLTQALKHCGTSNTLGAYHKLRGLPGQNECHSGKRASTPSSSVISLLHQSEHTLVRAVVEQQLRATRFDVALLKDPCHSPRVSPSLPVPLHMFTFPDAPSEHSRLCSVGAAVESCTSS